MASGPTLPPQAYTREILTAAFNWLQTQPDSVRKMATTPDALVGIFTRAKRFGNSSLEADAPVSSQNFMSDLKNLAEGLREFDEPREQKRTASPAQSQSMAGSMNGGSMSNGAGATVAVPAAPRESHAATNSTTNSMSSSITASSTMSSPVGALNERSRAMIQEVKSELNLSSDAEAINMIVAVAYKSLKDLLT